ncbi:dihydrofolate reductase [Corynebacterium aquatimens]|uniref:dihydrofolate reductase n=1 Tax=Corynebacterium aquatimens TaxID=1190508 RepID=UPI002541068F|nr:dihydrofolate reductase [Corynebacterium aquatimens]QYH20082.1 dihydrofolate reductase [Corynebacterium aquatimens]
MPTLGAIWAQSLDGVIGDGDTMPWHLPEDLRHFKEITMGHPIIMGRRTWEALPVKPLPGRPNHVLSSREPGTWSDGAYVSTDLPDLAVDAWIIGGGQLYEATIDEVDVIERTLIDVRLTGAVTTPVFAPRIGDEFALVREGAWETSKSNGLKYKYQRFERI